MVCVFGNPSEAASSSQADMRPPVPHGNTSSSDEVPVMPVEPSIHVPNVEQSAALPEDTIQCPVSVNLELCNHGRLPPCLKQDQSLIASVMMTKL